MFVSMEVRRGYQCTSCTDEPDVLLKLCFDSMVFLLTVARTTYIHWHQRRRFAASSSTRWVKEKEPASLLLSLFRDGAFYFGYIFSSTATMLD